MGWLAAGKVVIGYELLACHGSYGGGIQILDVV